MFNMGEELNKREIDKLSLLRYEAVSKFKSVRRAIRRGHVSVYGFIYPDRPFNNRTAKKGTRSFNELRKKIYGRLRDKNRVES